MDEDDFLVLPSFEDIDDALQLYRIGKYLAVVQSDVCDILLDVAALHLESALGLPVLPKFNVMLLRNLSCDIIPHLELKLLTDCHNLLLISFELLYIDHQTAVFIHVFDALVILEVPDFDVAFAQSDQDVSPWHGINGCDFVPMAFVDDAELSLGNIDEVDVHVF